jgi:hypothetical protein
MNISNYIQESFVSLFYRDLLEGLEQDEIIHTGRVLMEGLSISYHWILTFEGRIAILFYIFCAIKNISICIHTTLYIINHAWTFRCGVGFDK